MKILIFVGIPLLVWVVVMLLSLGEPGSAKAEKPGRWNIYTDGSPQYRFDYQGRLWVEKKKKGLFQVIKDPKIPPDQPGG